LREWRSSGESTDNQPMPDPTPVVLALSDSHDAGAAVIVDGRMVAAVNEERLDRRKMSGGLPVRSIPVVLRLAGLDPRDVTDVAVAGRISLGEVPLTNDFSRADGSFAPAQRVAETLDGMPVLRPVLRADLALDMYRRFMPGLSQRRLAACGASLREAGLRSGIVAAMRAYDHHDAHLASAYYTSGMDECLILSNDGFGDGVCCKVAVGKAGRLRVLSTNSFFNSIGVLYNYATRLCGFLQAHHAGKTTGLAAYGSSERTVDAFRAIIDWDATAGRYVNRGSIFRRALRDLGTALQGASREDIAAGVQRHLEEVLVAQASHYLRETGLRRIVLVGGVHANVKVNQRIAALAEVEELFVYPHMGDGGLAAGAGFLALGEARGAPPRPYRLEHVYLGPAFEEEEMSAALVRARLRFTRTERPAAAIASMLAANQVVARFVGAMEYGPRALCHRSILYPATNPEVNRWLNEQLRRTEFMPFAPVLRMQDAGAFFTDLSPAVVHAAEFMTITLTASARMAREAPATVHVDGTARPQFVRPEINSDCHEILDEYFALTGLSVLVNTSFNMHEEPIVCSPGDAVRAFLDSNIDALAMGPFIARHPSQGRSAAV